METLINHLRSRKEIILLHKTEKSVWYEIFKNNKEKQKEYENDFYEIEVRYNGLYFEFSFYTPIKDKDYFIRNVFPDMDDYVDYEDSTPNYLDVNSYNCLYEEQELAEVFLRFLPEEWTIKGVPKSLAELHENIKNKENIELSI